MSNTVRIKRRVSGALGAPAYLANAELAFNEVGDGVLYYGKGLGSPEGTASAVIPIGGSGAFVDLSGTQTITGSKTFTGSVDLTLSNATAQTQISSDNSTKLATTAFVKSLGYITGNQSITLSGDVTGSGSTEISVTLSNVVTAGTYTKITVDSKGRATSGTTLSSSDIPTLTANKISDFDTQVRTNRLDQLSAPTANVGFNNIRITNLSNPADAQDAATKWYVDSVAQGLDVKASVRSSTSANISLSGEQIIDGVSVVSGDRVLVKNQTDLSQNGVYVVSSGSWARAADFDTWSKLISAFTFVEEGATNSDTGWVCTANSGGVLETTSVVFVQFSGAGTYLAGNGLNLSGSTFSVTGTNGRISVSGSGVDISSTYIGQTSITTLGTISVGTWGGTTIGVSYGGTGVTSLTGLIKGNGTSAFSSAVEGTDYLGPNSTIDGGVY